MAEPPMLQALMKSINFYGRFAPSFTRIGYVGRGLPFNPVRADYSGQTWLVTTEGGRPRIADVIAEGMSLRLAQRNDYSSYITRNGNDVGALIRALEAQVSQGAGLR